MAHRARVFCIAALLLALFAVRGYSDSVKVDIKLPSPLPASLSDYRSIDAISPRRTLQQLNIPGFSSQVSAGNPALPCRILYIALPPDADEQTLSLSVDNPDVRELPGVYEIRPAPFPRTSAEVSVESTIPGSVYSVNAFYPQHFADIKNMGRLRSLKIAEVQLWACRYNPITGKILSLRSGSIRLSYKTKADDYGTHQPIAADMATFLVNSADVASFQMAQSRNDQPVGYAIITTSAIVSASTKLAAFVAHQQSRGFVVKLVTETAWGGGTGDTAANNIRKWLTDNYLALGLKYVLLIGDPTPSTSAVPMKLLWPRRNQKDYRDAPSDYFYADLTGNWDLDADNYYGEYPDDFGEGGVDRIPELYVGRIPFYGDVSELDKILQKTITYESTESDNWRRDIFLPMKALDTTTPGYQLGEEIAYDIALPANMNPRRAYDSNYGLNPPPECIPCDYTHVASEWQTNAPGVVLWMTHGSAYIASGVLTSQITSELDDSRPSIVFCASCDNGYPESSGNLGYCLLRNGAVCTESASRVAWYYPGTTFKGSDSIGGLGYQYMKHLITDEQSCGQAAYESRLELPLTIWMNHLVFNLYGDPSLKLNVSGYTEINGKITDISGSPVSGASVATSDGKFQAISGIDGRYSLTGLDQPSVNITVTAEGYATQHFYKIPTVDKAQALDFTLVPVTYASITGTVRDQFGSPLAGVSIVMVGTNRAATTGPDGSFSIENIEPGFYSIIASKAGYYQKMLPDLKIDASNPVSLDFILTSATINLIKNGDFEAEFMPFVATGWFPYSVPGGYGTFQTGFDQSYEGQFAQKVTLPQPTMAPSRIGIYQTIPTKAGELYHLSAMQRDYFSGTETEPSENIICRIGVDFFGGSDPEAPGIFWQDFPAVHKCWNNLTTSFTATSSAMTIFIEGVRKKCSGGNYCFAWFDSIALTGSAEVPAIPRVSVSRRYIRPDERFTASWVSADTSERYEYAIASSADADSIIPGGGWRSVGNEMSVEISGLNLHNGDLIYVLVRAIGSSGISSETGVSPGLRVVYDVAGIPEAKLLADGIWVRLSKLAVTRMANIKQCFLQTPHGIWGIGAIGNEQTVPYMSPGTTATIVGCMSTESGVRVLTEAEIMPSIRDDAPNPLGMSNSSISSVDFGGDWETGVMWSRGATNVGSLVKVWGRVIETQDVAFTVDDGSTPAGLTITCANGVSPAPIGSYVSITGIAAPNAVIVCSKNDITLLK